MVSDMGKWKRSQVCLWVQGRLVSAYYVTVAAAFPCPAHHRGRAAFALGRYFSGNAAHNNVSRSPTLAVCVMERPLKCCCQC